MRSLVVVGLFTIFLWSYGTVWLIRDRRAAHAPVHVAADPHELPDDPEDHSDGAPHGGGHGDEHAKKDDHGGGEHGGGHDGGGHGEEGGGGASIIAQNPIPKIIRKRQDGRMEPGHDLVDPEIKADRGLASLMKGDVSANLGSRFVELPEVVSATRAMGKSFAGKFIATIFVEVGTYEAQQEVIQRRTELKGVVDSLVAERTRDYVKTPEGMAELKRDVLRELNHLLQHGRITDVLFSNVFVM